MAQCNAHVGAIEKNTALVLEQMKQCTDDDHMLVFPELFIVGYPPEDLLLRPSLSLRVERALEKIANASGDTMVVVGYPKTKHGQLFNAAGVFYQGKIIGEYFKQELPNYRVFDEHRYFVAGNQPLLVECKGYKVAIAICEDLWFEKVAAQIQSSDADIIVSLNASPYHQQKWQRRDDVLQARIQQTGLPLAYVNMVGAQDELIFDGGSCALNSNGQFIEHLDYFSEEVGRIHFFHDKEQIRQRPNIPTLAAVYQALVMGVRDYVQKNGFKGVLLGLSGGIDSALTLAIAVDALGADAVEAVMMPFRYTSDLSQNDAEKQANTLRVRYQSLSIEPMYEAFMQTLAGEFADLPMDTTEQNIQARCRGVLLMAMSNKKGSLVLTTGNKSEVAVGYCTLYGDMAGGFDVLKDVSKMQVFALAKYCNRDTEIIPWSVIERPPSAELAPDQKDEDNLPPYEVLDEILYRYIEQDMSAEAIISDGFDANSVNRVIRLVDINEYKRRQAAIGPRVTSRAFGRDRRYPITNGWTIGD